MATRALLSLLTLVLASCADEPRAPAIEIPTLQVGPPPIAASEPIRYSITVQADGSVFHGSRTIAPSGAPKAKSVRALKMTLADIAGSMERVHYNPIRETGPLLPGEPLFVLADGRAPARSVLDVLEACELEGIHICDLRFPARRGSGVGGFLEIELPREVGISCGPPLEHPQLEVLRIRDPEVVCWREFDGVPGPRIARTVELDGLPELARIAGSLGTDSSWSFAAADTLSWEPVLGLLAVFAGSGHAPLLSGDLPPELIP